MVPIQYTSRGRSAKEISDSLEAGIAAGGVLPGAVLPSVRALAADLAVAPGTVATAYKVLRDRGLVETRGRNGTQVCQRPPVAARSATLALDGDVTDLASGQPDPHLLPALPAAQRAAGTSLSAGRRAAAPGVLALPELLDVARARFTADGAPVGAMTVTSGGLDAVYRVLSAQLRLGDAVAVEDPGWPNVLDLIAALGLRAVPMALDAAGPRPERLRAALRAGARAVIVTNRAQNPTGISLSAGRAAELRTVLADFPQTLVIEDDHAAELTRLELATLAGATPSWAFVRSTSKPYGPDLRVAVLTGDELTICRVEGRMRVSSGWVSTLLQQHVLDLWNSESIPAVIAAAAQKYDARRDQLISALADRGITATGQAGLNVWVPVVDETTTVAGLMQARWAVAPGSRFRIASGPGIRITVSALTGSTIPRLADGIAATMAGGPGPRYTT